MSIELIDIICFLFIDLGPNSKLRQLGTTPIEQVERSGRQFLFVYQQYVTVNWQSNVETYNTYKYVNNW